MTDSQRSARAVGGATEAHDRVRAMIDASLDAVIAIDPDGRVVEWSRQAETIFGWSRDEAMGRALAELVIPERYRAAHVVGLERARRTGEGPVIGGRIEIEAVARDGREFPVELSIAAIRQDDGYIFSAFIRDISERKAAERRRLTLEALNEIAYAAGKPLDAVRLAQFVVTYARDLLKTEVAALYWSRDRGVLARMAVGTSAYGDVGDAARAAAQKAFESVWPAAEGRDVAVPLAIHGRTVGALAVRLDEARQDHDDVVRTLEVLGSQVAPLIEVARLHEEIRDEQERFGKAFERNPSGLTIARASDRVIIEANPAFLEMVGYARDEVIGRRATDVGFTDTGVMRDIRAELDTTGVVRGRELRLRAKDGTIREVIGSFELADLHGEAVVFGTSLDVTERRAAERQRSALEERLRRAERLESMGRMAGGIAHDFNNLIGVILNYTAVLAEEVADRPRIVEDVEEVRLAAQRAADLTRDLMTFSRSQPSRVELLDVTEVVSGIERLMRHALGERIDVVIACRSDPCSVYADRAGIERVVMNLAINARDAMQHGGRLEITTTRAEIAANDADAVAAGIVPGRYVRLDVADTGVGMSKEAREHAFEPFFTTKPTGHGTGLGLATVYAIVAESGGMTRLASQPGTGTVVSVFLPAAKGRGHEEPPVGDQEDASVGNDADAPA